MKKTIAILLAFCLCVGLCACGNSEEKETTPITQAIQYENIFVDQLKIGNPLSETEKIFGKPILSKEYENYGIPDLLKFSMQYDFSDVEIYGLSFKPSVLTGHTDNVLCYSYTYYSESFSEDYEYAFTQLVGNYKSLLGEPTENYGANDTQDYAWILADGSRLSISNWSANANTYKIYIKVE
jgi:hypothetical protein